MRTGAPFGLALVLAGCTGFTGIEGMSGEAGSTSSDSTSGPTAGSDPTVASTSMTSSGSASTDATTSGPSEGTGNSTTSPTTTDGPTETTTEASSSSDSSSSSSESSSSSSSSSSSGNMGDDPLGMPCSEDMDCDVEAGQECCTDSHCTDTCMVPCSAVEDCPAANMGCEHGYCLFQCDNDDEDCAAWPGYTCEHGGTLCELT